MTGGIGFSRQGSQSFNSNRSILRKKEPFQRVKENEFVHPPKLKTKISRKVYNQLLSIKNKREEREDIVKVLTLIILIITAI